MDAHEVMTSSRNHSRKIKCKRFIRSIHFLRQYLRAKSNPATNTTAIAPIRICVESPIGDDIIVADA